MYRYFQDYKQGEFTITKMLPNGVRMSDGFEVWWTDHTLYKLVPVEDEQAVVSMQVAEEDPDRLQKLIDRVPEVLEAMRQKEDEWRQQVIDRMQEQPAPTPQGVLLEELPDEITAEQYQELLASGQLGVNWAETRKKAKARPSA